MSGKAITQEQVKLFMKRRNQGDTQQQAGAKAGISEICHHLRHHFPGVF